MKFCKGVTHETPFKISTDVIYNDVILLKSEHFRHKALNYNKKAVYQ